MPSSDDHFTGDNCYISVYSQDRFYLHDPTTRGMHLEDVIHALSNLCRFNGHTRYFYSVLEHQLLVSEIIRRLGGTLLEQYEGLMHDSTETWLADVPAPWKGDMVGYYELEHAVWQRVARKFHLPTVHSPIVKKADWLALFVEAIALVTPLKELEQWVGWTEYGEEALALRITPHCYPPPTPGDPHPAIHDLFRVRLDDFRSIYVPD